MEAADRNGPLIMALFSAAFKNTFLHYRNETDQAVTKASTSTNTPFLILHSAQVAQSLGKMQLQLGMPR